MNKDTIDYYNQNAERFAAGTVDVSFTTTQDRFLGFLPAHGKVLDFGCGSGRDTKYFLDHGYSVDAVDGSEELCKLASQYTGIEVRQMYFNELDERSVYDGIWACSSILHVPFVELHEIFQRMKTALKTGGVMYTSFKYGNFEGMRNGRYFTDLTEQTLQNLIDQIPDLVIVDEWISNDVRPDRASEKWLNTIIKKVPENE
ncbi:class I SAM-dependent methyltransferase [Catenisphaera adipataccumulans]|jgi:SAM-dependent methyltransferase|uniref:SAM-dependent methyltransferase n=1 Tax=Catenisphaera adipataccumulans TaxID=700500 RepID=A0A7W8FYF8_9FIRM|nr:class I SAM-dependent methyltransferase [Catenisphaera adipataccumulans]MBB5183952.1 SAM-dependent methyltransferase [Catenisphaera adipataccumulans]